MPRAIFWRNLGIGIFGVLLIGSVATLVLAESVSSHPSYNLQVEDAVSWINGQPKAGYVSVDEDAFGVVNSSGTGSWVYFDPGATAGPYLASYQAAERGAGYIIVTSALPDVFASFTSYNLFGAPIVYSSSDVNIFKVTSTP